MKKECECCNNIIKQCFPNQKFCSSCSVYLKDLKIKFLCYKREIYRLRKENKNLKQIMAEENKPKEKEEETKEDKEIIEKVLKNFEEKHKVNLRVTGGWDANDIFDYIKECCKEVLKLKKLEDD